MKGLSIWSSFRYAFAGLKHLLESQRSARIHVIVGTAAVGVGLALALSPLEWAIIALTIGFVIVAETMNTVAELAIDLVIKEYDEVAKQAKDVAAAAVLLAAITSIVVGGLIFIPHIIELLSR